MKKGITLIELVIVTVIVGIVAMVFYGLITQMVESGSELMGKKESYQQAKEVLKQMANEIRYNLRGGDHHNLGVWDDPATTRWQETSMPCTPSQLSYFPNRLDLTQMHTFRWNTYLSGNLPMGFYLIRIDNPGSIVSRIYTGLGAAQTSSNSGSLLIRYFDDEPNDGTPAEEITLAAGSNLTYAQAKRITRLILSLTMERWDKATTLSETIFVREKGPPPVEGKTCDGALDPNCCDGFPNDPNCV